MSEPEMEHMDIPQRPDGEPNFKFLARNILSRAWLSKAGETITIYEQLDNGTVGGDFLAWYDGRGAVEVFESCMGNKFAASITLALQDLAPSFVRFRK
jgi:hypothetical protein